MPSIDERVVAMAFENAAFERGVAQTMKTLGNLDTVLKNIGSKNALADIEKAASKVTLDAPVKALDRLRERFSRAGQGAVDGMNDIEKAGNRVTLEQPVRALDKVQAKTAQVGVNAADGFNDIERASGRVNLQGLTASLDSVTAKFSTLQATASVALGNIASQAAMKGGSFAKSFAFGPLSEGLNEYKTNLGSIQTILANTEGQQVSGLDEVQKHLQELNTYSDQTIYNFSQMAKNIGTFTAAGVDLDTATASIKGIANLAALSGSSAEQASTAMYQLSQSIAAGKVGLQDWNSVVNAGMGGRKFQNALIQTGLALGTIEESAVKVDKATGKATINGESFRESIMSKPGQQSWLTSEVLTGSLETFTGDLSDAELAAKGFSAEQIKSIQATAKTAKAAATEVKTLPQAFDVAREAIGSGWAVTFQNIFGDFEESKKTFTAFSNTLNGFIAKASAARNKVLADWKKLGGRDVLIGGIKQAFENLLAILKPIRDAFRDIFPRKTGRDLLEITRGFADLMDRISPSAETVENLRRTFRGFFALLSIGKHVIGEILDVLLGLLGVVGQGGGGFLAFTGGIGDMLVALEAAIVKGEAFSGVFDGIAAILEAPVRLLKELGSAFVALFSGDATDKAKKTSDSLESMSEALKPLSGIIKFVTKAWEKFIRVLTKVGDFLAPIVGKIGETFSTIGDVITDAIVNSDYDRIFDFLQTTLLGGIFYQLKKGLGIGDINIGSLEGLNDVLKGVTGNLQAMQRNIQAKTLLAIATAVTVLAGGIFLLSEIDPKRLTPAMTAVAIGMGQLVAAFALLGRGGIASMLVMPVVGAGLILVAGAMVILAGAVKLFSTMDWDEIARGLTGVGGSLVAVGLGLRWIGPSVLIIGPGLILVALAMNVLAVAVKQFSALSWEEMGKGIAGLGSALIVLSVGLRGMGPSILLVGPGLVAAAFGLTLLAAATKSFASMNMEEIYKGVIGLGLAVASLGLAVALIPPNVALTGAGLIVLSIALMGIGIAVKRMGDLDVSTIAKGISGIGAALLVLAIGLQAMARGLPGAAALMVASLALAALVPTLVVLGHLSWGVFLKGLAIMAITLGVLALVGSAASSGLLSLGIALGVIAGAGLLAATATLLFAKALVLLGNDGAKGLAVMVAAMTAFIALLPKLIVEFAKGSIEALAETLKLAPSIVEGLVGVAEKLLEGVVRLAPRIAMAMGSWILAIITVLDDNAGQIASAGIRLFGHLLGAIDQEIDKIIPLAARVIVKFLTGLAKQAPAVTQAAAKFLVAWLTGISQHLAEVVQAAYKVAAAFLTGVAKSIPRLIGAAAQFVAGFLKGIAKAIPTFIDAGANIVIEFLSGMGRAMPRLVKKGVETAGKFLKGLSKGLVDLVNIGFQTVIDFLNGIADAIRKNDSELFAAGRNIMDAIIDGVVEQAGVLARPLKKAIEKLFGMLPGWAKDILGIKSPSKEFMIIGEAVVQGMIVGLEGMPKALKQGITNPLHEMLQENQDLRNFSKFLTSEFREGLFGGLFSTDARSESEKKISATFDALQSKLTEEQTKFEERIKENQGKLQELLGADKKDETAIMSVWGKIRDDRKLLEAAKAARTSLITSLKDEEAELIRLSGEYELHTEVIGKYKEKLAEMIQARDNWVKQYSTLPDVSTLLDQAMADADMTWAERREAQRKKEADARKRASIDQVALYKQALQEQIVATQKYMETLNKLKDLGLDDVTYQKLVDQGLAGQEFATQLLSKGKGGIAELNKLNSQLAEKAMGLANEAVKKLHNAGIEAVQGLIDGLTQKQGEIRKAMEAIAATMIGAIKKQLGIKSPSRVLAEVGEFAMQGMAGGLKAASSLVSDAAASVGDEAAEALTNSLANISEQVQNGVDTDLTITPILDLTQIQKDASKIQDLSNVIPITAAASYGQATAISDTSDAAEAARAADASASSIEFKFEQNNNSPKALDEIEIYRQTNNQLSQVKSALGLATAP